MEEQKESRHSHRGKLALVLLSAVIVVLAGGLLFVFLGKNGKEEQQKQESQSTELGYEDGANVVTNEDDLQRLVDGMVEQAKEGTMSLEYKNSALSSDGTHFSCYLANAVSNGYDMYMGIYLDGALSDEILLTKLLSPGSGLKEFEASRKLEPGSYDAILVFTRVEEDHKTIKDQVQVTYTLNVQ